MTSRKKSAIEDLEYFGIPSLVPWFKPILVCDNMRADVVFTAIDPPEISLFGIDPLCPLDRRGMFR